MRTIDQMVQQEVIYCVSTLVSDLTMLTAEKECWAHLWFKDEDCPEQSCEDGYDSEGNECSECSGEGCLTSEVFEHWIISDWLADKLEGYGEIVERDFHGLTIWGRTTTGQSIALDWVIEKIYQDACKRVAAL